MKICSVSEAKAQLSALLEAVLGGDEVVISRAGRPVARLVPYSEPQKLRQPGAMAGEIWIASDFDELPEDLAQAFGAAE